MPASLTTNRDTAPDPYLVSSLGVKEPPTTLGGVWQHLCPGFVLSAAVVGSGELIATTSLGAKAGFTTFWVIVASCLLKVVLQLEWGRHVIHSGETTMKALNQLPGPRLGRAGWPVWLWLLIQAFKFLQMGGIIGGVAIILHMALPFAAVWQWAVAATLLTSLLVFKGYYRWLERGSLWMMLLFTLVTLASVAALQFTPYHISRAQLQTGLTFGLPPDAVVVAIAAFGITGVGGDEILYYNYWCLEKGYAAYTGPNDGTLQWERRARGWTRILCIDALLAMVVYTLVTAAFYLLGAAVLHGRQGVPDGYPVVEVLSNLYTHTLGPWAKSLFLAGAFAALYSTLFTAAASFARIFADAFGQLGWIRFQHLPTRRRTIAFLAWLFPAAWCALFLFFRLPVGMILAGGFMTSVLLLVVIFAALHFRYRRLPAALRPSKVYDSWLWLSSLAITAFALYGLVQWWAG